MKYNVILSVLILILFSSCQKKDKNELVIYPEYCRGCIERNFAALKSNNYLNEFDIYFDTTDVYLLNYLKQKKISFHHIDNQEIPAKFGDYANIVVINLEGETIELKTNETIEKGVHF